MYTKTRRSGGGNGLREGDIGRHRDMEGGKIKTGERESLRERERESERERE